MNILSSLARTESGGNFGAVNNAVGSSGRAGHFGRLQFGRDRLDDAIRAGVIPAGTTPEQFMADPEMQQRTEAWHIADLQNQAERLGLTRYIGQEINGIPITMDAIVAMGHLGGMGGAKGFLESGGQRNPADVFGTSLADYARTHGGVGLAASRGAQGAGVYEQRNPDTSMARNAVAEYRQMPTMPQINALDAAAFQTQARARPTYGFGAGQNPFVR